MDREEYKKSIIKMIEDIDDVITLRKLYSFVKKTYEILKENKKYIKNRDW